jgi:hypothetical protein
VAIDGAARFRTNRAVNPAVVGSLFALGALALGGEAAVHVQQYISLVHGVRWIGPLVLADAVACVATIAGLAFSRSRVLAALAGVVISAGALGSLVVSYGRGLFGFYDTGFRTAIELAVVTEIGAVILLTAALAASTAAVYVHLARPRSAADDEATELAAVRRLPLSRRHKKESA